MTRKKNHRARLRWRLAQRHEAPSTPHQRRSGMAPWTTFRRRRELVHLAQRALWRRAMRLPRRRPIYGFIPFHHRR